MCCCTSAHHDMRHPSACLVCRSQGVDAGLSQIARKSSGEDSTVVWNFPIDLTFKSTNAFGWPRIAISVSSRPQPNIPPPLSPVEG